MRRETTYVDESITARGVFWSLIVFTPGTLLLGVGSLAVAASGILGLLAVAPIPDPLIRIWLAPIPFAFFAYASYQLILLRRRATELEVQDASIRVRLGVGRILEFPQGSADFLRWARIIDWKHGTRRAAIFRAAGEKLVISDSVQSFPLVLRLVSSRAPALV